MKKQSTTASESIQGSSSNEVNEAEADKLALESSLAAGYQMFQESQRRC